LLAWRLRDSGKNWGDEEKTKLRNFLAGEAML
jgi:hypothetical protein